MVDNVALFHRNGRLITGPSAIADDNIISFSGGAGNITALIKITEPISPMYNYFEIKILNKGEECAIGIGVGSLNYPQGRMPGWNKDSIGYHADDGHLYHERGIGEDFGPQCTEGDIMGCGIVFDSNNTTTGIVEVFFTKNGQQIGTSQQMKRPINGFYTLLGLHSAGEKICYLGHSCRTIGIPLEPMTLDTSPSCYWFRSNGITFTDDGLTLEYSGSGINEFIKPDIAVAQAIHFINTTNHYFEMTVINSQNPHRPDQGSITIGLAGRNCHCISQPGTYLNSVGYSVIKGKVKADNEKSVEVIKCDNGDVIGCGIVCNEELCSVEYDNDFDDLVEPISDEVLGTKVKVQPIFQFGGREVFHFGLAIPNEFNNFFPAIQQYHDPVNDSPPVMKNCSTETIEVYFTVNGEIVHQTKCSVPSSGLYPTISLCNFNDKVSVNFEALSG